MVILFSRTWAVSERGIREHEEMTSDRQPLFIWDNKSNVCTDAGRTLDNLSPCLRAVTL